MAWFFYGVPCPILLVHGFGGDRRQYRPIIEYLSQRGFVNFYEFEYGNSFGQVSVRDIAQLLSEYVHAQVKENRIFIIGVSQGGDHRRVLSETVQPYGGRQAHHPVRSAPRFAVGLPSAVAWFH